MTVPKLAVKSSGYGGRGYAIPGRTKDSPVTGKPIRDVYPSVTTVLSQVAKPGLHQWIADQTAAKAVASLSYLQSVSEEVGMRSLQYFWSSKRDSGREVRNYFESVRDDAADLGTNLHEWVEADIDGLMPYPEVDSIEMDEMIEAWLLWFEFHEVIPHNQEFTCVNDRLKVAGTADADWTITCLHTPNDRGMYCLGREPGPYRTLVDLKTSRHTWRENGFQLAALASCDVVMREVVEGYEGAQKAEKTENGRKIVSWWVEDAPPVWERYALLHIRPDDLDTKGNPIPRFASLLDRTEDMDVFMSGFEGALALTKSEHTLKERAKARGNETEDI